MDIQNNDNVGDYLDSEDTPTGNTIEEEEPTFKTPIVEKLRWQLDGIK